MAQVDFTNAILEPNGNTKPMSDLNGKYMVLAWDANFLGNNSNIAITQNASRTEVFSSGNKITWIFTGTFIGSGTEFYIGQVGYHLRAWKVSNITFSAGDTYSFAIDVEISVV